jgi:hypothetical protein
MFKGSIVTGPDCAGPDCAGSDSVRPYCAGPDRTCTEKCLLFLKLSIPSENFIQRIVITLVYPLTRFFQRACQYYLIMCQRILKGQ